MKVVQEFDIFEALIWICHIILSKLGALRDFPRVQQVSEIIFKQTVHNMFIAKGLLCTRELFSN